MPLNPEQIKAALSAFAADWLEYDGTERSGAQLFLQGLFECFGLDLRKLQREEKVLEAFQQGKFLDLKWPSVCIFEMKAPGEANRLAQHRRQALDYWGDSADAEKGIQAAPYVVLCAFHRFEIWQPGLYPKEPRIAFDLVELSEHYDSLEFLTGGEPVFVGGSAAVTADAAKLLAEINRSLVDRREGGPADRRNFLLQCVWSMFAEDLGQIPRHAFTRIIDELITNPRRSSADELGQLFAHLNDPAKKRPEHGSYAGVPYANGGLFEAPARLHLNLDELRHMKLAASANWNKVEPQIFGSLLENTLGHDKQWEMGAHYTHEAEMQQIIQPTITRPWRERIDAIKTTKEAAAAQDELMRFVVLDPACGSGNFLYLAYRELRRIERDLQAKEAELRDAEGLPPADRLNVFFPIENIRGIELDNFAVRLARVTLWMGHALAVRELGLDERTLPLADLSGIVQGDALALDWPRADAIIGNPPYHGSQNLREVLGDDRVEWLQEKFGVGVQDFCVYWFRKAADVLGPGGRAGLVGTNSVSQNRARAVSLNYVVEKGGVITDAVSRQKWPGEATVNVSIVNWVTPPPCP